MTPTGTTPYGQPRTFSATVVNVGLGAANETYTGNITFKAGYQVLCTAPVINNASLLGTTVSALQHLMSSVLIPPSFC